MVDDSAVCISRRNTVVDQALVHPQIREVTIPFLSGHAPAASGSSGDGGFLLAADAAWWLGYPGEGVGRCQAEFGGPAFDMGPEPVSGIHIVRGYHFGERHRGDGGVAVHEASGQPGDVPGVLMARYQAGGVPCGVAADALVLDGQGHARFFLRGRLGGWMSWAGPVPVACFQPLAGR